MTSVVSVLMVLVVAVTCVRSDSLLAVLERQTASPTCGPVCDVYCEHGLVRDSSGCEICRCREGKTVSPTCGPVCDVYCEHGLVRDSSGCEICRCRQGL
ncbi:antistasin-like [Littorina saxatilis]|uniref:Antistasin-like domain-containing protein n=1 Tax=Littorina saxatilis TaxID=31220 RepID=A0AAN9FXT1_9CAEN